MPGPASDSEMLGDLKVSEQTHISSLFSISDRLLSGIRLSWIEVQSHHFKTERQVFQYVSSSPGSYLKYQLLCLLVNGSLKHIHVHLCIYKCIIFEKQCNRLSNRTTCQRSMFHKKLFNPRQALQGVPFFCSLVYNIGTSWRMSLWLHSEPFLANV